MVTTANSTKQKIIDAAISLFAERGFHESSMRDIAAAVGMKAASLYSHFESKQAILRAILESYQEVLANLRISDSRLEEIARDFPAEIVFVEGFKLIQSCLADPRIERIVRLLFNEMFKNPLVSEFGLGWSQNNIHELARIFAALQKRRKLRQVKPDFIAFLYDSLLNSYFQEYFVRKACGRESESLVQDTMRRFEMLAKMFS